MYMFLLSFSWLLGVDFVDPFSSLVFLDYIRPFNICCKWILLTFACLKSFLFLHQFWMSSLPGTVILVVDFFFSLAFLDYVSPFSCKAGLVILNSLNFCLSEKYFISPSILNEILAGYSNLGYRFFPFSTLNISCHSLLACRISAESSTVTHMGFPLYVTVCFSLAFNILSLCLVFVSLISMCLGMFLLGFILYGTLCASWTWLFPFPCWGNFQL